MSVEEGRARAGRRRGSCIGRLTSGTSLTVFLPERFLGDRPPPYTYVPFAAGPPDLRGTRLWPDRSDLMPLRRSPSASGSAWPRAVMVEPVCRLTPPTRGRASRRRRPAALKAIATLSLFRSSRKYHWSRLARNDRLNHLVQRCNVLKYLIIGALRRRAQPERRAPRRRRSGSGTYAARGRRKSSRRSAARARRQPQDSPPDEADARKVGDIERPAFASSPKDGRRAPPAASFLARGAESADITVKKVHSERAAHLRRDEALRPGLREARRTSCR